MIRAGYALVLSLVGAAAAAAQTPSVSHAVPSAGAPGQTVEVTLRGAALADPAGLWTSFPSDAALAAGSPSGDALTYRLTLPPETPVGIGALRVVTRGGVSNLLLFMVDDLPTTPERGGNASAPSAQELSAPVAVEGACEALASDFYRVKGTKGQRLSVEVVAARLGSTLDPVVRLLDESGRELHWADDSPGAGSDCRFSHTFPADGTCVIEIRDANYDGGPAYRYRLRVGDFPIPVVPFPLGGKRGSAGLFRFLGEGCDDIAPVLASLPAEGRRVNVSARRSAGGGSGFASVIVGDLDETVEAEPNDTPEQASPLAVPTAVSGRLEAAGDVDYFKLRMRKGERFAFRAQTRSAGSPCDLFLQLRRADGTKIAESKVEGPADATFDATAPAEDTYWLRVEEIGRAGGPGVAYRIEAEPYRPGFALGVESDKVDAPPGGEFEVKVTCTRRDYGGAIALTVQGIVPAPSLEGAVIPAGKNEAQLKVKLPPDAPKGLQQFRIIGNAKAGDADVTSVATTAPALLKLFPRLIHPPIETDGQIAVGVRNAAR